MGRIVSTTLPCGKTLSWDEDVLNDRVKYAEAVREKLVAGDLTPQEATKLLNEYGKKHKHWR